MSQIAMTATRTSGLTAADAASCLPRKSCAVQLKTLDESTGSFELYALAFGNVDRQGDVIEPGAVTNIDELVRDGWIALNHDQMALPIAVIDSATQDAKGLLVTGRWHSTPYAQAVRTTVLERLKAGKRVLCSIGYAVEEERYETADGQTVRHIDKISVYECSIVNLPANPQAEVVAAKSFAPEQSMSKEARVLQAVKRALGLAKKGSYKVDGEDLQKAKGLADKCMTNAKAFEDAHKSMKSLVDAHKAACDELVKCLKSFEGGQEQDSPVDDGDNDVDEDTDRKPAKEDEDDDDKDDEDEDEKTAKAYRDQLRKRALTGRRSAVCP
jgi:HK97 family phage prohead protease